MSVYLLLWRYRVKPDCLAEFESIYNSDGDWAALFKRGDGYLGTELLHDADDLQQYLTVDRWTSAAAYQAFRAKWIKEYEAMDSRCDELTETEAFVGAFTA